ncbi:MAG: FAD-dependent thymidylate synthase [Nanoarchaeota archaeon]|nr:FAD-dependent thymidylate synthase [Nanoarchaeota archaeon]MBU1269863.1 FAD-dependent thymidylate synthase [Nanoarchaeota archaeon]MBU1604001.1 FAD-dependent thymidylate synthase [Nanoarchaeota archaeon]MBU2443288.1 FAD-dependent thymidylate synthase [Nanoarchaeota archaeon]
MNYTEDEKKVLNYYFTNLDKEIFATKHFHPEVWALMQARYSRSNLGLRESFLKLLKEDPKNFEKLKKEIEKTEGGLETEHAAKKAIQFMEKWVLGFGHSSVAEGAVVGLGLEGVSILATKVIEDNRLSSFIEKSTRYVSFNNSSFYIDKDLKESEFYEEIVELLDFLFKTYSELHEPVLKHIMRIAPLKEGTTEVAWKRACEARRFDAVRYLLPTCTKTSLGWTVNARQLAHAISKLLSHPLKEMNEVGEMVKEEAMKVLPSLLRFADKNEYLSKTDEEMRELAKEIIVEDSKQESVALVKGPENPDEMILSAIIYKYKNQPFNKIFEKVKAMTREEKEQIFDNYLKNMGKFDYPMRELEHEQFTFDVVMDYGAFRDLQRHRICTQTNQVLTTNLCYDTPKDIKEAGVKKKYTKAMEKAKELYEQIREKYPLQSQYILPLGFRKRFLITMNLRELYHFIKLRTVPFAHESYRKTAYNFYEIMKKEYPLLSKYIVCNYAEEELGRLKSEEQTEKLETVGPL